MAELETSPASSVTSRPLPSSRAMRCSAAYHGRAVGRAQVAQEVPLARPRRCARARPRRARRAARRRCRPRARAGRGPPRIRDATLGETLRDLDGSSNHAPSRIRASAGARTAEPPRNLGDRVVGCHEVLVARLGVVGHDLVQGVRRGGVSLRGEGSSIASTSAMRAPVFLTCRHFLQELARGSRRRPLPAYMTTIHVALTGL